MKVIGLDHLVLTVNDIQKTIDFYTKILGMQAVKFGDNRQALNFGTQKINLHPKDNPILPNASHATCGSADLCLLVEGELSDWLIHLKQHHVDIIDGIVPRTGAVGAIRSIYIRDPDRNLIELSCYD